MKKLSLLVALILVVTIGGVYATWSYSESSVNEIKWDLTPNLQSYVGGSTAEGSLKVVAEPMITIVDNINGSTPVGDPDTESGDKIAELEITGNLVVLFSPFTGYTGEPLDLSFHVAEKETATFLDKTNNNTTTRNIFTVTSTPQTVAKASAVKLVDNAAIEHANTTYKTSFTSTDLNKYYYVIEPSTLKTLIQLNGTFTLETLEEYHDFEEAIEYSMFTVHVTKANS